VSEPQFDPSKFTLLHWTGIGGLVMALGVALRRLFLVIPWGKLLGFKSRWDQMNEFFKGAQAATAETHRLLNEQNATATTYSNTVAGLLEMVGKAMKEMGEARGEGKTLYADIKNDVGNWSKKFNSEIATLQLGYGSLDVRVRAIELDKDDDKDKKPS